MSSIEIVLGLALGLVVNETTDLSPWLGRALVSWSARLRYGRTARAETRTEELRALINARPGKLFKLFTGLGFASSALVFRLRRFFRPETSALDEPLSETLLRAPGAALTDEDEPSTVIVQYLFPTERYRGEWRRHWINPGKRLLVILLYTILGIWAAVLRIEPRYIVAVVICVAVGALLLVGHTAVNWYFSRFVITNKRLMTTKGVFRRRVEMVPLLQMSDFYYVQTLTGRLLNYGTFKSRSTGGRGRRVWLLKDLPYPSELYLRIIEEIYEPQAVEDRILEDEVSRNAAAAEAGQPVEERPDPSGDELVRHLRAVLTRMDDLASALRVFTAATPPAVQSVPQGVRQSATVPHPVVPHQPAEGVGEAASAARTVVGGSTAAPAEVP